MSVKRLLATITLVGFAIICAIAFNIAQPTMDMGLHCTVHDYLVVSLGGSCDMVSKTFITFFDFFVMGVVVVVSAFVYFFFAPLEKIITPISWRKKFYFSNSFYLPLFEFYSNGAAASRRFA